MVRLNDADIELAPLTGTSGEVHILSAEYEQKTSTNTDEMHPGVYIYVIYDSRIEIST